MVFLLQTIEGKQIHNLIQYSHINISFIIILIHNYSLLRFCLLIIYQLLTNYDIANKMTTQMKSALSQIITQKLSNNQKIYISIVQKDTDLGLSSNSRLFILIELIQFGYISKYKQTDNPASIDLSKMKDKIPIKNLVSVTQENSVINIIFFKQQNGKKIKKTWTLKLANQQLAIKWKDILILQKSESIKRRSPSPRTSNLDGSPPKSDIKKSQLGKINKSQTKFTEYNNNLYETDKKYPGSQYNQNISRKLDYQKNNDNFVIQQDPKEDKTSDLNDANNKQNQNRKIQQIQKEELHQQFQKFQKFQREQQKKIQAEREQLRKQKEQIENEKSRMKELASRLRDEQQKLQRQKIKISKVSQQSNINAREGKQNKDITILNQNYFKIEDDEQPFAQKNREVKDSNVRKKPKVQNFNYYEIVNKLVTSNQMDLQRERESQYNQFDNRDAFDSAHDYILELERNKVNNRQQNNIQQNNPKLSKINKNKRIQESQIGWTFRYIAKQHQGNGYEVVSDFGDYCQTLLKQLVDQFHLPDRKKKFLPKYKREEFYAYEKDDVEFKIAMIGLKQIYHEEDEGGRDKICDNTNIKMLENQFKNFQILFEATKKESILKVPLTCLTEYRGFVGLFKANSYFDRKGASNLASQPRIETNLQYLSQKTRISLETLTAKGNLLILKLDQKIYGPVSQALKYNTTNFDFYIIQEVNYLMPLDTLYRKKSKGKLNQKEDIGRQQRHFVLRKQILQNYVNSDEKISSIIFSSLKKTMNQNSTTQKKLRQSRMQLEQISQNILIPITEFIKSVDQLTTYFSYSKDLSDCLHSHGINLRYLGLIYEHTTLQFNKSCLLSEISARTCKILLRKTIQDLYLQANRGQSPELNIYAFDLSVKEKIIDFFNCILGNNTETVTIWKVLSVHSMNYYQIKLQYDRLNKGMFLMALSYHCGLFLDWENIDITQIFDSNEFFHEENFLGTFPRTKTYTPLFSLKQEELLQKVQQQNPQCLNDLIKAFDLSTNTFPERLKNSKYNFAVRKYLASFIPPQTTPSNSFKHLKIYEYSGLPTRQQIEIQFMELKWYLRRQKKQKYVKLCSNLIAIINDFFGDFHPLLSELYDIFSLFHQNNGQFEDAITFSKSSIVNMLKICGSNHPKTAESYFQLAQCCIKCGKKQQTVLNLQKAKKIFEACDKVDTVCYAQVTLKLGLLFLSEDKIKEAETIVKYSLDIFQKNQKFSKQKFQDEKVEALQILYRCYELQSLRSEIEKLGKKCENQLRFVTQSSNYQKILKMALSPRLLKQSIHTSSCYIDIINTMKIEPTTQSYIKSFERLCNRIGEDTFFENLSSYLQNITNIENYLKQNATLKNWKKLGQIYERQTVNDFISLTQEIIYFLGEGYLIGLLKENL